MTYNRLWAQISDGARRDWEGKKKKDHSALLLFLRSLPPRLTDRPTVSAPRLISNPLLTAVWQTWCTACSFSVSIQLQWLENAVHLDLQHAPLPVHTHRC